MTVFAIVGIENTCAGHGCYIDTIKLYTKDLYSIDEKLPVYFDKKDAEKTIKTMGLICAQIIELEVV